MKLRIEHLPRTVLLAILVVPSAGRRVAAPKP